MAKDEDQKICEMVLGRIRSSSEDQVRQSKVFSWEKSYKNWHSYMEKKIPRRANMFVPLTHQIIEKLVAFQQQSVFNADGFGKFMATKSEDVESAALVTSLFNYSLRNKVKSVVAKFHRFFQHKSLYGVGIFRTGWVFDFDVEDGRMKIRENSFGLEPTAPRNFFVDPLATELSNAKWCSQRIFLTKEDMRRNIKMREYKKALSEEDLDRLTINRASSASSNLITRTAGVDYDMVDSLKWDPKSEWIECYEYFSIPDNEYIVCTAKEDIVLRKSTIPWDHHEYPFAVGVDIPDPEVFWGKSTAENIFNSQAEVNAIRNSRMDRMNFLTNPMFLVKNQQQPRKELISRPGHVFHVREKDDISRMDMGNLYNDIDIENEQIAKTDAQVTSTISDYTQASSITSTATGASIVDQNARAMLIGRLQHFDDTVLKPIARQWQSLQKQFYDEPYKFFVDGEDMVVRLKDFAKEYDFYGVSEVGAWNRQARQNATLQLYSVAKGNPYFNQPELAKDIVKSFGKDARLLANPNPTMPAGEEGSGQIGGGPNPDAYQLAQPSEMGAPMDYNSGEGL